MRGENGYHGVAPEAVSKVRTNPRTKIEVGAHNKKNAAIVRRFLSKRHRAAIPITHSRPPSAPRTVESPHTPPAPVCERDADDMRRAAHGVVSYVAVRVYLPLASSSNCFRFGNSCLPAKLPVFIYVLDMLGDRRDVDSEKFRNLVVHVIHDDGAQRAQTTEGKATLKTKCRLRERHFYSQRETTVNERGALYFNDSTSAMSFRSNSLTILLRSTPRDLARLPR